MEIICVSLTTQYASNRYHLITYSSISVSPRYILFCFLMVFLAFVEFAFISFIGIFIRRLKITDAVLLH